MGVHETGEQKAGPVIGHRRGAVFERDVGPVAAERDPAVVFNHQGAFGNRDQRRGGFGYQRSTGEVKDVAEMNPCHVVLPLSAVRLPRGIITRAARAPRG